MAGTIAWPRVLEACCSSSMMLYMQAPSFHTQNGFACLVPNKFCQPALHPAACPASAAASCGQQHLGVQPGAAAVAPTTTLPERVFLVSLPPPLTGIQLPHSHNPLSEAVNVLLSNAGLMAYVSSSSQLAALSPAASMAAPSTIAQSSDAVGPHRQQQQHQRHRSDGSALLNGAQLAQLSREGPSATGQQQQQQLQKDAAEAAAALAVSEEQHATSAGGVNRSPRSGSSTVAAAATAAAADTGSQQQGSPSGRSLQRNDSSRRWSRDLHENAWMLEWDSLGLDPNRRRIVGTGSYG